MAKAIVIQRTSLDDEPEVTEFEGYFIILVRDRNRGIVRTWYGHDVVSIDIRHREAEDDNAGS